MSGYKIESDDKAEDDANSLASGVKPSEINGPLDERELDEPSCKLSGHADQV